MYYVPLGPHSYRPEMAVFARVRGKPYQSVRTIEGALQSVRGSLPKVDVEPFEKLVAPQLRPWRYGAVMFLAAAVLTALVAALSLYALLSYLVVRRTREFGVRLALGAEPAHLVRLVLWKSATLVTPGVLLGGILALLITRPFDPLLFGVRHTDPLVYLATMIALAVVSLLASYVPIRRAAVVDPAFALRSE